MTDGPSAINMIERWLDEVPTAPGIHPQAPVVRGEIARHSLASAGRDNLKEPGDLGTC